MKTSHTPGPWKWIGSRQSPQERIYLSAPEGYVDWTDLRSPEAQANARLIAAAPELLNALELAEATLQRLAPDGSRATQGTRDVITAALRKATQP